MEGKKVKQVKRSSKEVRGEWRDERIKKLIAAVHRRPVLWSVSGPDYRLPKPEIWQEVSGELGDVDDWADCRAKWQSLRVTYKTNLAKLHKMQSGESADDAFKIHWRFFDAMKFIDSGDIPQYSASTSNTREHDQQEQHQEDSPATPALGQRRKRKALARIMEPSQGENSLQQMAAHAIELATKSDSFSIFADYIAEELRRLPAKEAHLLQRRLSRTMLNFFDERESINDTSFVVKYEDTVADPLEEREVTLLSTTPDIEYQDQEED